MQDWFYDLVVGQVERVAEEVESWRSTNVADLIEDKSWFIPGLPGFYRSAGVAAVDGGSASEPLHGGGALYVARSIAIGPSGAVSARKLFMGAARFRSGAFLDFLRSIAEYEVALEVVEELKPGDYLLMDGSLTATLYRLLYRASRLVTGRGRLDLGELEADALSFRLIGLVGRLMDRVRARGVRLVYVSKDFSFRVLKEFVLLRELYRAFGCESGVSALCSYVSENMHAYPARGRERLLELLPRIERYRPVAEALLNTAYRDSAFIDDVAAGRPGWSQPMVLGVLHPTVRDSLNAMGPVGMLEYAAAKVELFSGRKVDDDVLAEALDYVVRLPSVNVVYLKPGSVDHPLMIEYPYWDYPITRYFRRKLREPDLLDEEVVSVIRMGYKGQGFYNTWLVRAHLLAKVRGHHMKSYVSLVESALASRGVRLPLARRVAMRGVAPR